MPDEEVVVQSGDSPLAATGTTKAETSTSAEGTASGLEAEGATSEGAKAPSAAVTPKSIEELTDEELEAHPRIKERLASQDTLVRQATQAQERAEQHRLGLEYAQNQRWQDDAKAILNAAVETGNLDEKGLGVLIQRIGSSQYSQLISGAQEGLRNLLVDEKVEPTAAETKNLLDVEVGNWQGRTSLKDLVIAHAKVLARQMADRAGAVSEAKAVAAALKKREAEMAEIARKESSSPTGVRGGAVSGGNGYRTQVELEAAFIAGKASREAVLEGRRTLPYE